MSQQYSLSEAFRLAESIEENGLAFYTQAAQAVKDKQTREILLDLADKEKQHANTFAEMRRQYCQVDEVHLQDQDGQVEAYLKGVAENHVFNLDKDVTQLLASVQSSESVLRLAMTFEKDTIVFFSALKNAVTEENREAVERLIQEEIGHIQELQKTLKALPASQ